MRKEYWLDIKDPYTKTYMIATCSKRDIRDIYYGVSEVCFEHVNWFRYLEGVPPKPYKDYQGLSSENSVLFGREMIRKHYDLETFERKEHV